jgi:hypothetical protein
MPAGLNGLQLTERVRERQPVLPAIGYLEELPY